MKLCCLLIVFLIVTISTVFTYSDEYNYESNSSEDVGQISPSFIKRDRLIVKRSQRNANILYRYCRLSGGLPQFCLKYAVRMIFATGH